MILARPTSDGAQNLTDKEIDEIIATFDANGDGELQVSLHLGSHRRDESLPPPAHPPTHP